MIMFGCCLTKTLVAITFADAELKEKLIFYALRQTVRYDPRVVHLRCVMPLSSTGSSHAARALLLWREHHPQRVTNNNPAADALCAHAPSFLSQTHMMTARFLHHELPVSPLAPPIVTVSAALSSGAICTANS